MLTRSQGPWAWRSVVAAGILLLPAGALAAPKPTPPGARLTDCAPGAEPCHRTHAARLALGLSGLGVGIAGAALIFAVGDRAYAGDPNFLLAAGGFTAALGALAGQLAALPGKEGVIDAPVTPSLLSAALQFHGAGVGGGVSPPVVAITVAPTLTAPSGAYVRIAVSVRAQVDRERHGDPRPQVLAGFESSAARGTHELGGSFEPEFGVPLPYPLGPASRAAFTGRVSLLWRPSLVVRSLDSLDEAGAHTILDRFSFMPANVGMRWQITPRQQLTVLLGPRFDGQRLGRAGQTVLPLGAPQVANVYGEVVYRIDMPFPRAGLPVDLTGRLTLGYAQWKADGQATDLGASIGYFGPFLVRWDLRVARPTAWGVLVGVGATLAPGGGALVEVGLAPPTRPHPKES